MVAKKVNFYTVSRTPAGRWHIKCNGSRASSADYATVQSAKMGCFLRFGVVPIACYGDEVPFNSGDPCHAALARIEARHNPLNEIVGVAPAHYLIRRSRFGVERPIHYRYSKEQNTIYARKDSEAAYVVSGFNETSQRKLFTRRVLR